MSKKKKNKKSFENGGFQLIIEVERKSDEEKGKWIPGVGFIIMTFVAYTIGSSVGTAFRFVYGTDPVSFVVSVLAGIGAATVVQMSFFAFAKRKEIGHALRKIAEHLEQRGTKSINSDFELDADIPEQDPLDDVDWENLGPPLHMNTRNEVELDLSEDSDQEVAAEEASKEDEVRKK